MSTNGYGGGRNPDEKRSMILIRILCPLLEKESLLQKQKNEVMTIEYAIQLFEDERGVRYGIPKSEDGISLL